MPFLDNFICFCGNGMIESMLEPHLKDSAGANQTEVGLTFLILGGVYMATTPITGYVRTTYRYRVSKKVDCGFDVFGLLDSN